MWVRARPYTCIGTHSNTHTRTFKREGRAHYYAGGISLLYSLYGGGFTPRINTLAGQPAKGNSGRGARSLIWTGGGGHIFVLPHRTGRPASARRSSFAPTTKIPMMLTFRSRFRPRPTLYLCDEREFHHSPPRCELQKKYQHPDYTRIIYNILLCCCYAKLILASSSSPHPFTGELKYVFSQYDSYILKIKT